MRRRFATSLLAVPAIVLSTALPAAAQDGGTGGATPDAAPIAPLTTGGLLGGTVRWNGPVRGPGTVRVERLDEASGAWTAIASATAADDGTFAASWTADALGAATVRAVLEGTDPATALVSRATVYRGARATWYGPGFYGHRLACGGGLRAAPRGGAHRTLPRRPPPGGVSTGPPRHHAAPAPGAASPPGPPAVAPAGTRRPAATGPPDGRGAATAKPRGVKKPVGAAVLPKPAAAGAHKPKARRRW